MACTAKSAVAGKAAYGRPVVEDYGSLQALTADFDLDFVGSVAKVVTLAVASMPVDGGGGEGDAPPATTVVDSPPDVGSGPGTTTPSDGGPIQPESTPDGRTPGAGMPDGRTPDSGTPHSGTPHSGTSHSGTLGETQSGGGDGEPRKSGGSLAEGGGSGPGGGGLREEVAGGAGLPFTGYAGWAAAVYRRRHDHLRCDPARHAPPSSVGPFRGRGDPPRRAGAARPSASSSRAHSLHRDWPRAGRPARAGRKSRSFLRPRRCSEPGRGEQRALSEQPLPGGSFTISTGADGDYWLDHSYYGTFGVAGDGSRITCAPNELPPWVWQRFLVAQPLPLASLLHGHEPPHASAVGIDGRAVLLMGTSGAGKSSIALQMAARGATFLADDAARWSSARAR